MGGDGDSKTEPKKAAKKGAKKAPAKSVEDLDDDVPF